MTGARPLVVDDDLDLSPLIAAGYEVIQAQSGEQPQLLNEILAGTR